MHHNTSQLENLDFTQVVKDLIAWEMPSDMCIFIDGYCYYDIQVWSQAIGQVYFFDEYPASHIAGVLQDTSILVCAEDKGDRLYRLDVESAHKILCL